MNTLVSSESVRDAIKIWIDEAGNDVIENIFNNNFDHRQHQSLGSPAGK